RLILVALALLLLCRVLLDLALGPARYSLVEVLGALLSPDSAAPQVRVVMWDIRLPVALMAVAVGAALSLAGAQMQTILNNPLASPFT
ncbi:iron chelate uptake ABC transporter family permease subunit, partial [Vibrio cholerae]